MLPSDFQLDQLDLLLAFSKRFLF